MRDTFSKCYLYRKSSTYINNVHSISNRIVFFSYISQENFIERKMCIAYSNTIKYRKFMNMIKNKMNLSIYICN